MPNVLEDKDKLGHGSYKRSEGISLSERANTASSSTLQGKNRKFAQNALKAAKAHDSAKAMKYHGEGLDYHQTVRAFHDDKARDKNTTPQQAEVHRTKSKLHEDAWQHHAKAMRYHEHISSHPENTQESNNMTATKTKKEPTISTVFESFSSPNKVDRENGIVKRVKVLGYRSKNGGTYTRDYMESAKQAYERAKVNINHPDRKNPGADRDLRDRIGLLEGISIEGDGSNPDEGGMFAETFRINKKHPDADWIMEAMDVMPDTLGFSHNAITEQVSDGKGGVIHNSLKRLRSVDLVANPATTNSVYESEDGMDDSMGGDPSATPPVDPSMGGGSGDPMAAICSAFCQQLMDIYNSEDDVAAKSKKAKDLFKKSDKIKQLLSDEPAEKTPDPTPPESDDTTDTPDETDPTKEELESMAEKQELIETKAEIALLKAGIVEPTKQQIKAVSVMESDEDKNDLIKSFKTPTKVDATQQVQKVKPKSTSALESINTDKKKEDATKADEEAHKEFVGVFKRRI